MNLYLLPEYGLDKVHRLLNTGEVLLKGSKNYGWWDYVKAEEYIRSTKGFREIGSTLEETQGQIELQKRRLTTFKNKAE